jgi:haloalkane dehalogenase
MEAAVTPVYSWNDWPEEARKLFQTFRSDAGEELILENNAFVEMVIPAGIIRKLSDEEMNEYRRPYLEKGEGRLPTLIWPRQIPVEGDPADVTKIVDDYGNWLAETPGIPKLFINAEPGSILLDPQREFCRTWPDQTEITVPGIHYVQEDSSAEIGEAIAGWLSRLT